MPTTTIKKKHRVLRPGDGIHAMHSWEVASRAARLALNTVATDVGKVALELDTKTFWILRAASPAMWTPLGESEAFVLMQTTPSTEWVLAHGLRRYPAIVVVDSDGYEVVCDVRHDSINQATVLFSSPLAGTASAT